MQEKYKFESGEHSPQIAGMKIGSYAAYKLGAESLFYESKYVKIDEKFLEKFIKTNNYELISCEFNVNYGRDNKNYLYLNDDSIVLIQKEVKNLKKPSQKTDIVVKSIYTKEEISLKKVSRQVKLGARVERNLPSISVLVNRFGDLATKKIEIEDWDKIKIKEGYYNKSFKGFRDKIKDFPKVKGNNSLVLVHGPTGTGKTTFLRWYMAQNKDSEFIYIPSTMTGSLSSPDFMDFLGNHEGATLVLEDAEKTVAERGSGDSDSGAVSNLLQMTDGILNDIFNIKVIVTFNCEIDKIDEALTRSGRMFASYSFENLKEDRAIKLAKSLNKDHNLINGDTSLAEVFSLGEENTFNKKEEFKKLGFNKTTAKTK